MSGLIIDGDVSDISDRQLKYITTVIEELGYKNNKVSIEPVGKEGDNYVANVKRIIVKDGHESTFKMIAKIAPTLKQKRQMGNTEMFFQNETIMYTKVLPKYSQLEIEAGIPPEDRIRYAKCYGSFEEAPEEVIILEDLNESDFVMLDRLKGLESECIQSVLKNFAKLHALGYALKNKEPINYDEYKNSLYDMWSNLESRAGDLMNLERMENSTSQIVNSDVHKKVLKGALTGAIKQIAILANNDRNAKQTVIQQGDAWINNILFKFDDEDNLSQSIMIDYQLSKHANPASDLLYLIFNCTDYETRKEHFYDWIDYYHKELESALFNHGLRVNFIYPKDQLDVDLKRYAKTNFAISLIVNTVLSMKAEEASRIKSAMETSDADEMAKTTDMNNKHPETIALFKKRIEGLIDSYLEFGLLQI